MNDRVNHPAHYGGATNPYEAIKIIEIWRLNFCAGNALKYAIRAGHKDSGIGLSASRREDICKASWHLMRQLQGLHCHSPAAWVQPLHYVEPLYEVHAVMNGLHLDPRLYLVVEACRYQADLPKVSQGVSALTNLLETL